MFSHSLLTASFVETIASVKDLASWADLNALTASESYLSANSSIALEAVLTSALNIHAGRD